MVIATRAVLPCWDFNAPFLGSRKGGGAREREIAYFVYISLFFRVGIWNSFLVNCALFFAVFSLQLKEWQVNGAGSNTTSAVPLSLPATSVWSVWWWEGADSSASYFGVKEGEALLPSEEARKLHICAERGLTLAALGNKGFKVAHSHCSAPLTKIRVFGFSFSNCTGVN